MSRTHLKRKVKHNFIIALQTEGLIHDVFESTSPRIPYTLEQVLSATANLAFIVETLAHLQGKEKELLPHADLARSMISALQPRIEA